MKFNHRFRVTFRACDVITDSNGANPKLKRFSKSVDILAPSSFAAVEEAMKRVANTPELSKLHYPTYTARCLDD